MVEGVIQPRHDHRLVEHETAVADRIGVRVDRVVEAAVGV